MVSLFKDRSTANVVWVLLLSIALHCHFFIFPPQVVSGEGDGLLSLIFNKYLAGTSPVLVIFLYHLLVISQALRLNYLFNDHRMFSRFNFYTAMAYVLVTAVFAEWNNLTPALVANSLIIAVFGMTMKLYNSQQPKSLLFNIGMVIGLSVLLYHPTALLVVVVLFAVLLVRPFNLTELLVMFMGVLAPYYFLAAYLFLTDRFSQILRFVPTWKLHIPKIEEPVMLIISLAIILIELFVGLFNWQNKNRRMLIQVRKNWEVLILMLIIMIPLPFVTHHTGIEPLLLWTVPLCPFIGHAYLEQRRPLWPNMMFWLLVALVFINNWGLIKLIKN